MNCLLLFNFIVIYCLLRSSLLTTICSSFSDLLSVCCYFCSNPFCSSKSTLICLVFLHLPSLCSVLIWSDFLVYFNSPQFNILTMSKLCSTLIAPLIPWFALSICASWLHWISLDQLAQLCSFFFSSGPPYFSSNDRPLDSISPLSSVYHNIESINDINVYFIVIVFNIIHSLTHNYARILVLNSDRNSIFCPGCAEQA